MVTRTIDFVLLYWPLLLLGLVVVLTLVSTAWRRWLRVGLRVISRPLLLLAVVALVYDGTMTLAGPGRLSVTSLDEHWKSVLPRSYEQAQRKTPAVVWTHGVTRITRLPAWILLGGLGISLAWLGRRRHDVNIFAN